MPILNIGSVGPQSYINQLASYVCVCVCVGECVCVCLCVRACVCVITVCLCTHVHYQKLYGFHKIIRNSPFVATDKV